MRSLCTSVLRLSVSLLILASVATPAYSGEIWTDGNGDGLPDLPGTLSALVGDNVQVDVWIDARPAFPGACCFEVDQCMVITESACADSGGIFFGEGTECTEAGECPIQTGACCSPQGICSVRTREACEALGHVYQGNAVPCSPGLCPDLRGACCLLTGICSYVLEAVCLSGGGVFYPDSICSQVDCVQPFVACCFPQTGLCQDLPRDSCDVLNGIPNFNTTCAQISCPHIVACCFPQTGLCRDMPRDSCDVLNGNPNFNTTCAQISCPQPGTGACCFPDSSCVPNLTRLECEARGGSNWSESEPCSPQVCDLCVPRGMSQSPIARAESKGARKGGKSTKPGRVSRTFESTAIPCPLTTSTNGTEANYRWYNLCSNYIWVFDRMCPGEGVGVLFGGAEGNQQQPAVNGDNDVKRAITYYRNVAQSYNTVNVFVDVDNEGDGCPDYVLASDLGIYPALRWNCSEFNADIPCGVQYLIVRTVHGTADPRTVSFATDGPFTDDCDPAGVARSFYYGLGNVCVPWDGPTDRNDNFLCWLILDESDPCPPNAVESTSWGRIKGLFR